MVRSVQLALAAIAALASPVSAEPTEPESTDSGEVIEVTSKAPEETKPTAYTLSAKDIASTPGAMNDALRAITILPSTARIPFSFGGVVLRGMSPRDSSVFVDGVEIPIAYHFGGITGVFPTQVLQDMRVVPSGFDVSYGRTQGGVVELTTRAPRGDKYRVGGEASLLHSQATAEGPMPLGGAFLVSVRRSYFDLLARPAVEAEDPLPSYTDAQFRAEWGEVGKRGRLALFAIGSLDRIANDEAAAVPNDPNAGSYIAADLGFLRVGASYKRKLGSSLVTIAPSLGTNVLSLYSKDYHGESMPEVIDLHRRWYVFGTRAEWLRDDAHGFLRAGIDLDGGYLGRIEQTKLSSSADDLPLPRNTVLWGNASAFLETRRQWYGDRVSVRPGVRIDRFGLGEEWTIDPRINAHVTLSDTSTLRASLGRFHQPPSPAHFDEFTDNLGAKSSYVDQATLGVEIAPSRELTSSVTGFFHEGRRTLVDVSDGTMGLPAIDLERVFAELLDEQLGRYGNQANIGRQRSYGIEAAVRYDAETFRVLANFAWSRAKRLYDPALGNSWEPYGLDQPLRLNVMFATSAHRWNIGGRLSVASGNPIHLIPQGTPVDPDAAQEPAAVVTRLPTFWQLDVRVDRTWRQRWGDITLFFDLQNVTNHRNVEVRESTISDDQTYRYQDILGLPIIPYIGVEFAPR